ncbi:MAG: indole-3-glycerol phosphate synthase TrpC [Treponema sp.]|nr:indole-3-glycerol phosphate synthase TrpC [Treponema sp.]
MNTIIDEIAAKTRRRLERAQMPQEKIRAQALELTAKQRAGGYSLQEHKGTAALSFEQALMQPGLSFICEVKKASPSKGVIAEDFPYLAIAREYEEAGAAAVSVLTEPDYFLGDTQYLREISRSVKIPALRKDFIIDPCQIYESKLLGAKAVLLICALLDGQALAEYLGIAAELDMDALVEIHDEAEADTALRAGARIIGINNRDLKTFQVDFSTGIRLRGRIPPGILTVAESGINCAADIRQLRNACFDAVLIGESLMRAADKKCYLAELRAACHE